MKDTLKKTKEILQYFNKKTGTIQQKLHKYRIKYTSMIVKSTINTENVYNKNDDYLSCDEKRNYHLSVRIIRLQMSLFISYTKVYKIS